MDEHRQLVFVNQFLPSSEQKLIDRMRDAATRRITRPPEVTAVLRDIPMDSIADVVVGPRYVGVLFTDGQISRYPYVATVRRLAPSASPATTAITAPSTTSAPSAAPASGGVGGVGSGATAAGSAAAAAGSFLQRTAKFRRYESNGRVLLAAGGSSRGARPDHRSVIIDRARPMLPASSVPEDLIAQAQVVLQGKTREVIIRELQRTNLNVNEAVNNLLSRDDDDDDGSEGAEMCIPEELLTLLDSSHGGVLESDLYPPDSFEYLMSSRERRSKLYEKEKEKQKSTKPVIEANSDTETLRRYEIPLGSISEPWEGLDNKEAAVGQTPRFTHIACTQSEVLAISTDYKLYGWKWSEAAGDVNPHPMFEKMKLGDGEVLTHLSACTLRVAVMTSAGRISSWLDTVACGERLSEALFVPPQKLQQDHQLEQLVVSNHLAVARFPNNVFYWCGLYPVNDRRRIFEKARTRQRKHVTFDTTQIVEGSEVRTKSGPIYSIGCIAANLSGPTPMVGILMENAWSLSEVCRFRLLDPSAYDSDRYDPSTDVEATETEAESRETAVAQHALVSGNRKRPATEEVFGGEPKMREEPWPISDVIFIHEEVQNDTAIVKIVDGGHCAVEYQEAIVSPTDGFATNASKQLASKGDKEKPKQKMRLIRKDELTVVSHKMRYARSPNSMRIEPYRFVLSGSTASKRVISAVADSLGIRALVERRGIASIVRISVCGKTLTSHPLPLHAPSLHSNDGSGGKPTLMNYGDDSILLLRDAHGGIIPLVRDAAAGFKEPVYMQLSASSYTALTVKSVKDKERPSWAPKANREAVIISMQGTHPRTLERRLPSLLYAVMGCDEKAVKGILDILQKEEDLDLSKREIVDARADGNRNILHAAVMNAFATKNSLEADVENPVNVLTNPETRKPADKVRATLDKKWNEMLRTNRSSSGSTISTGAVIVSDSSQTATDPTQGPNSLDILVVPQSQMGEVEIKMEIDDSDAPPLLINPSPIENPKKRQENAIAIVQMIVTHPICMPFLTDLLSGRDISGQTPFMAAVNHRAYSAARVIFKAVQSLFVDPEQGKWNSSTGDHLLPFLFPVGARPDDSPLFILCYNDPCSFTWTGDEHINQDIFECRTCGLTGSLCCCTECAFTCHRNHDCKLKRTSPTAYCDCWEKSCCNALVNGNQHAREELLKSLVVNSNLYTMLNGRGEHILLYLARKLARQQSEQWNYTRRPRRVQAPTSGRDSHVPEHDLDPPKFAKAALVYCLKNWSVIRSLAMIGVRQMDHSMPMAEEIFHLNNQHGSSHLDKFMLIILSKSSDETTEMLEALFNVLTDQHNKARKTGQNLEEVNFIISRFVRSVARLFILAVIISSAAASTAVSGLSPSKESSSILDRPSIRGITFSGIFGHLRKETSKDSKLKNMGMFIVRCKAFFEHFSVFALHEMAQLADASLAPVRTGILRPCVSLAALLGSSADSIEYLEKYINSEPDVTQQLMGVRNDGDGEQREERKEAKKRRKRSSRRDTDREEATSERAEGTAAAAAAAGEGAAAAPGGDRTAFRAPPPAVAGSSDSESDSDSDGEGFSSRRHASQSSALAGNEERNERTNDEPMNDERRERERNNRFGAFLDQFRSSDDEDEEDEEVDSDSDGEQREGEDDEDEDEELLEGEEGGEDDDGDNDELATSEGDPSQPTEAHNITHRAPPYDTISSREYAMRRIRREEEDERRRRREEDDEDDESSTNNWIPPTFDMPEDYNRPADRGGSSEGEGSRSASSPAYSSLSEGEEERPEGHRHRRRRPKPAAAAAAAANDAAAAAVGGVVQPPQQGEQANANVVDPAREERNEQRDDDGDVDMDDAGQVEVEVSETRDGTEYNEMDERDGSARTRPEGNAPSRALSHSVEELEALQAEAAAMAATVRAASEREERERREDDDEWTEERRRHEEFIANRGRPAGRMTARRGAPVPPAPAPPRSTAQRGRRNPTTRGGTANSGEGRTERSDETVTATSTTPSDRGGRTAGGWSYRRPPWITRSLGEAEARRTARDASRAEGEGESGSSSEEKKAEITAVKEDEMPTTLKAAIQLSAAFSFAVRMIGELLPVVAAGSTHAADGLTISPNVRIVFDSLRNIEELNEMEESVRRRAIDHVVTRLEDSWRWLAVVLDHTEAQIKYINAVTSTEESRKKESKEKKKSQRRKSPHGDRGADPSSSTTPSTTTVTSPQSVSKVKRETISCLLGILRAYSGEGGDDIPLVDLDTLRSPALVVDAYLGFVDARAEAEKLFELGKSKVSAINELLGPIEVEKEQEGILGMRRFYQRSNSVSFPGVSFTDAHDTLQLPCGQALPIVERPQLLTSTVEKEVIFGPPASTQERTREEHDKVIRAHGVSHPHNQSLTAAPISSHRLFVEGEEEEKEGEKMEEGDHAVQPIAPIVIPSVASAPAKMDEMADNEEKKEKKEKKSKRGRKRGSKGDAKEESSKEDESSSSSTPLDAPLSSSSSLSVVVAAPPTVVAPDGFETVTYEEILETFKSFREHPLRKLMGRWRFSLQLIAKELHADLTDTLGGDLSGSRLLRELAGFEMKQHELRARMEKYRATGSKDLSLEVHRDSALLVRETCHQLNRAFTRRIALKKYDKKEDAQPTLASHKVKVRFIDEPGEGTGVARSYYTALAEALASLKSLPFTDYGYKEGNDEYLYGGPMKNSESSSSSSVVSGSGRRIALIRGRDTFYATVTSSSSRAGRVLPFDRRLPLNYLHPPYTPDNMEQAEYHKIEPEYLARLREDSFIRENGDKQLDQFNDRLFILIRGIYPAAAARITGMFMDLPLSHIVNILNDPNTLRAYLADAIELMMEHGAPTDLAMLKEEEDKKDVEASISMEPDDAPLFFRPSKKAHYSPVPGRLSPARINAFRNVGRVIGLCLTQCEMFPLRLSRHVLKYILGRPLNWHDFAFYDPQMFESMRTLIVEGSTGPNPQEYFDALSLNFTMDMPHDSTGVPSSSMELCPGGMNKEVTKENIVEYVYCYVEQRLLGKNNRKCLAAIKQGVQDVLPQSMFDNLTAEDLRLVLCGTETVSLSMMQSYTTWTDESHAVPETIAKFKQWFWQVADRLSPSEKQDLIFFWTGAPSLPSTEEGFQPLPTIVIRPTDDGFLPTANTCISRLYLPLYNSKKTLIAKLQLAIKAKNFGFV